MIFQLKKNVHGLLLYLFMSHANNYWLYVFILHIPLSTHEFTYTIQDHDNFLSGAYKRILLDNR